MANAQLIQVAREIGASQGFNNVGADFEASISKWIDKAEAEVEKKETKRKEGDAKVAHFMSNLPSDAKLPKIPDSAKEKVTTYLKESRMKYAEHANALRDLDAKDQEYQEHVSEMNKINANWDNLNNQFTKLVDKRANYLQLKDGGMVSKGNSPEEIGLWSSIVTDNGMDISIEDQGFLTLNVDGTSSALDDLPGITEVDREALDEIKAIGAELIDSGLTVTEGNIESIKADLKDEITSNGIDSVRSIAADSDRGGLKLDHDLLYNPEREEELIETVVNQWLNIISKAAEDSKKQKDAAWTKKHPPKPAPPPKYSLDKLLLDE